MAVNEYGPVAIHYIDQLLAAGFGSGIRVHAANFWTPVYLSWGAGAHDGIDDGIYDDHGQHSPRLDHRTCLQPRAFGGF
jgi:hypothetical protein